MKLKADDARRDFLCISAVAGTGLMLIGCGNKGSSSAGGQAEKQASPKQSEDEKGGEVTATEDLMREHGVLRRALLIYSEAAVRLRGNPSAVPPEALQKTAKLFRAFGEEYHEKKLEEAHIFPAVKSAGGAAAGYPDILIAQHARGREITDYILAVTQGGRLSAGGAEPFARALESFVRMYRAHAAREDTIIFPAWKQTLTAKQLDEMGDRFEEIEHEQFGKDGFEDAVRQIGEIEGSLGLADLAQFTAPPPKL
ncbi:MAG TPA: hemerythrin domain-containing protein [Blastocatellia bacterium]|nr:hemerythrin domain-containing protein [Blastocatellia bacterium]